MAVPCDVFMALPLMWWTCSSWMILSYYNIHVQNQQYRYGEVTLNFELGMNEWKASRTTNNAVCFAQESSLPIGCTASSPSRRNILTKRRAEQPHGEAVV